VTANSGYESCYEDNVPDLNVDFQPDPIPAPGTGNPTIFTVTGTALNNSIFVDTDTIEFSYYSNFLESNPSYSLKVPFGNGTFTTNYTVLTPDYTQPNYVIQIVLFNNFQMAGCMRFKRNSFQ
ncbi:19659_t:CDS:1, partial [Gigaspora margarita]